MAHLLALESSGPQGQFFSLSHFFKWTGHFQFCHFVSMEIVWFNAWQFEKAYLTSYCSQRTDQTI